MKNIWKIFINDWKKILRNPMALIVIVGVAIIPSLYAWFNIAANWDPYGSTGGLKVAVANNDAGAELNGEDMNLGDQIIGNLRENTQMGWTFVDEETAIEGTRSGAYYAAIVIPEDFSQCIISVLSGDIERPRIIYYSNSKKNAIAPKITDKGVSSVQQSVNETFISTVVTTISDVVLDSADTADSADLIERLTNSLVEVDASLDMVNTSLNAFNETVLAFQDINDGFAGAVPDFQELLTNHAASLGTASQEIQNLAATQVDVTGALADADSQVQETVARIDAAMQAISDYIAQNSGVIDMSQLEEQISELREQKAVLQQQLEDYKRLAAAEANNSVNRAISSTGSSAASRLSGAQSSLNAVSNQLDSVNIMLGSMDDGMTHASEAFSSTMAMLTELQGEIEENIERLNNLSGNEDIQELLDILRSDQQMISDFMAAPVVVEQEELYPIENYGSAMTPFYTILAIWVGDIVLVAILKVNVKSKEQYENLKPYQEYLGRYLLFFILSFIQSTIIVLGDLLFLKVQCISPIHMLLSGWVAGFIFSSIIYTLTVSFGDVGKALCVILLVIQIAGAGGTFPIEVTPQFFQNVNPFLPFTHAINAMRESVAGFYGYDFWLDLLKLLCFLPFVLLLGLLLRKPLIHVNEFFEERLKDTELM